MQFVSIHCHTTQPLSKQHWYYQAVLVQWFCKCHIEYLPAQHVPRSIGIHGHLRTHSDYKTFKSQVVSIMSKVCCVRGKMSCLRSEHTSLLLPDLLAVIVGLDWF